MSMYAAACFFSKFWLGPLLSQFSVLLPSQCIGLAIAVFYLLADIGGTISNLAVGAVINKEG